MVGDRHLADDLLQLQDVGPGEHLGDVRLEGRGRQPDDVELLVLVGVVDQDVEHEPVELGLGERVGPFLLDRVLRRQDEERVGQAVPLAADGHLPLLHRLEQRGLGLGRGPVDLVGQHDVGEDRPAEELELADAGRLVLLDHLGPGDVRGHQVGRELDPVVGQVQGVGQGVDHQGLGQAGHADQQAVAAGEDRDRAAPRGPPAGPR